MITHIQIQNFRSFIIAEVQLQPFSLVVGANGSGKTNLLRFLQTTLSPNSEHVPASMRLPSIWSYHLNRQNDDAGFEIVDSLQRTYKANRGPDLNWRPFQDSGFGLRTEPENSRRKATPSDNSLAEPIPVYNLSAADISNSEKIRPDATVSSTGRGTTQVLDMLKNGDREDLFDAIETQFRRYVPEVEKLSLRTTTEGSKQIQVRERGLPEPLPADELSEGTRIILAILTIIHQERPPQIIMLEDIDRGLHPRLFEYLTPLMREIAKRHDINIIATTHNPYLVDAFQDDKEAVIIVEKKDGASTLSTLAQRLEGLDYDSVDPDDMPLGQLWFSGLVGGTPKAISTRVP